MLSSLTIRRFFSRELKIKTLRSLWTSFFEVNKGQLQRLYPGLNIRRFLLEVQDIAWKKAALEIDLDEAEYVLSDAIIIEMEKLFLEGTPFQYILEKCEFYHHEFYITPDVLIPRPETEYLVDLIIRECPIKKRRILDVGTGSGVILLSLLAHGLGEIGVGVDLSEDALRVAEVNRTRLGLRQQAVLVQSDRLRNVEGLFDLIVSNPPYIKAHSHSHLVHDSVKKFEPPQALYLPDDSYDLWFEEFFISIKNHLNGTFFMEGHELMLDEQAKILESLGFSAVSVIPDLTGTKRFLRAEFTP
jgi:release factor glutamine methyltransferase